MKKISTYCCFVLLMALFCACSGSKKNRKSVSYYNENKTAISELRSMYDSLYRQHPFSVGFTDKTFTYYVMEITTDTVRYIYNTEKSQLQLYRMIGKFGYDTSLLKTLATKMKEIKCLWLDKASFYINLKKDTATFLSFKSTLLENPFVENKYYVLLFLSHPVDTPRFRARIKKGDLVKVDEQVYFTIGNRFR